MIQADKPVTSERSERSLDHAPRKRGWKHKQLPSIKRDNVLSRFDDTSRGLVCCIVQPVCILSRHMGLSGKDRTNTLGKVLT